MRCHLLVLSLGLVLLTTAAVATPNAQSEGREDRLLAKGSQPQIKDRPTRAVQVHGYSLRFAVRDSRTGVAVPSQVTSTSALEGVHAVLLTDAAGRVSYQLPAGHHLFEVSAPDYRPLTTHFDVDAGTDIDVTLWLDPLEVPTKLKPSVLQSRLHPGFILVHGHVVDAATGQGLQNARVRLVGAAPMATTDERGYFWLQAVAPPAPPAGPAPSHGQSGCRGRRF